LKATARKSKLVIMRLTEAQYQSVIGEAGSSENLSAWMRRQLLKGVRPKPMNFNQQTIDWAKGKLAALETLRGYPKEERHVTLHAKALLNIAHPAAVLARWHHKAVTDQTLLTSPEELDAITITTEKLGTVNPMDWLMEEALGRLEYYPAPVRLRVLHARYFDPADGVTPEVEEE